MKCPNCGNEAQEDAVFCDHCGLRLRQPPVAAVAPAAPSPETPAIAPVAQPAADRGSVCQKCGASNLPGELFCGECGAPLAAPQPEPATVAQVQAASAPQATSGGPRLCPGCGAQVADGDEFCYACGADLRVAAATPAAAAPPASAAPLAAATPPAAAPATQGAQSVPPDMASPAPTAQPTPMAPAVAVVPAAPTITATECPTCGGKVNPGDSFCDNCGAALNVPGQGAAPGQPTPVAAAVQPVVLTPVAVQPTTVVPTPPVTVASPVVTQAPPVAPEPATSMARPRLVVVASGVEVPLPVGKEAMVGREDPYSGVFPDIDLTPHGAEQGGVSRRHFKITYVGGQYVIEDLNSTNFTVVNRQRLQPGAPAVLADGDEIRAGRVVLVFKAGA